MKTEKDTSLARESSVTLVTGSSSGIGLALAREFARNGHPVIIAAPVAAEVDQVAQSIASEFGVAARGIAVDLRDHASVARLVEQAGDIEILVNNAGFGQRGRFWEVDLDRQLDILRVNCEAVLRLTRMFLPRFVARGHGRILNTASVAGFEPAPLMATYHASKAFVLSLGESIATELEGTGVTLTSLCPGPVDTDFMTKADMVEAKVFQEGAVMAPAEVAEAGYQALMAGERQIVPGAVNKAMVFSRRVMPISAQAKMSQKQYEDAAKHKRDRGDVENKAAAKSKS